MSLASFRTRLRSWPLRPSTHTLAPHQPSAAGGALQRLRRVHLTIRNAIRGVVDLCYPGRCAACDADCETPGPLCEPCAALVAALEREPSCWRCAMPLVEMDDPCPRCLGEGRKPYERILRLGTFHDPLRGLIHGLKYHQQWPLGEFLADRLLEQERVKALLAETDCILPVPLHRLRQVSRGFNQAEVIARRLAKQCDKPLIHPLVRLRHTETQTHQHGRAERVKNLRNAFALIDEKLVRGRHVVIVDDVVTTGATLQSVARTLRPAGPASLSAIVIAIADPRGKDFEAIGAGRTR